MTNRFRHWCVCLVLPAVAACGVSAKKAKQGKTADATAAAADPVSIVAFDDSCATSGVVPVDSGNDGRAYLDIENASEKTHSIGYMSQAANVRVDFKQVVIMRPTLGSHSINIVLRDKKQCEELGGAASDCNLNGGRARSTTASDVIKKVVFVVASMNDRIVDVNNLGKNGGVVGDILRGDGLIGGLVANGGTGALGGMAGGGGGIGDIGSMFGGDQLASLGGNASDKKQCAGGRTPGTISPSTPVADDQGVATAGGAANQTATPDVLGAP